MTRLALFIFLWLFVLAMYHFAGFEVAVLVIITNIWFSMMEINAENNVRRK